jgi:mannose-6-phosphate isomerase-like protein (cupin superfamily)
MLKFGIAIAGVAMIAAGPALADVTFKHITAAEAAQAVAGKTLASAIAEGPQFSMSFHKRIESSHVEKHMGWDEELVIQEGDVLLNYGDTASNARETSPGEFNADAVTGGKSLTLHPGDVVILPAGTWHHQVLKSPIMRYILFKTRKQPG